MQVLSTVDSAEEAERLGRSIVGARLAACVQIVGPIRSLYWWQDKIDEAQEWQLQYLLRRGGPVTGDRVIQKEPGLSPDPLPAPSGWA